MCTHNSIESAENCAYNKRMLLTKWWLRKLNYSSALVFRSMSKLLYLLISSDSAPWFNQRFSALNHNKRLNFIFSHSSTPQMAHSFGPEIARKWWLTRIYIVYTHKCIINVHIWKDLDDDEVRQQWSVAVVSFNFGTQVIVTSLI